MPEQEQHAVHALRANAYRLLSDCFLPPAGLDPDALALLEQTVERLDPAQAPEAAALRAAYARGGEGAEALAVAYARLFVGPFDLLAPPYGSVYLEGERRVMGDTTMDAQQHYLRAGLGASREGREPPDHIATELEFMYYLAHQYVVTGDPACVQRQREFLHGHLARWVPAFAARLAGAGAPGGFYARLGRLLEGFIRAEERRLPPLATSRPAAG